MSQLSDPKEGPAEFVVTECSALVTLFRLRYTYLQLVFCPCISDDLPVVNAFIESNITKERSEEVVIFSQVDASPILAYGDDFFRVASRRRVPDEMTDDDSNDLSLKSQLFHLALVVLLYNLSAFIVNLCVD